MRTFRTDDYTNMQPPSSGGDLTTWSYDPASGVLTQKKDAANQTTDYTYNSRGLVETITQARYAVGTSGPRAKTTFTYLPNSTEITGQSFNDSGVTTTLGYTYDRSGLVHTITDATGSRTFAYDSSLQLTTETLDATFYGGRKLVRQYDTTHRPIGFTLQTSGNAVELQQTHAYDGTTGLFTSVTVQQGAGSPRVFSYSYETGTALLDKVSTGAGSTLFALDRDYENNSGTKRDLVSSIQASYGTSGAALTDFDYTYRDDRCRATARQSGTAYADYGDGSTNSESTYYRYDYNLRGELTSAINYLGATVTSTTTPLSGRYHKYGYDGAGNRKTSNPTGDDTTLKGDPNDPQNKLYVTSYTVNALNQITQRENPFLSVSGTVQSSASGVSVDGLPAGKQGGHWSGEAFFTNDNGPAAHTIPVKAIKAGSPDTGQSGSVLGVIAPDPETIGYDADGNLKLDGQWSYTFNQRNQLIKMTSTLPSSGSFSTVNRYELEFVYDYLGRRVEKKVTNLLTSTVTTRRYVYDGWNLVGDYAVSGGTIGSLQSSYAWGLDLAGSLGGTGGVGALVEISVHAAGVTDYYPAYDANGNVAALVKSNGTLAAAYDGARQGVDGSTVRLAWKVKSNRHRHGGWMKQYDPYGQIVRAEEIDSAIAGNPFRYSTKFTDVESGLVYYGHRYYSPSLGRFINRDPIEEQGGINLYAFAGNDPINAVDVLGLECTWEEKGGKWVLSCDKWYVIDSSDFGDGLGGNFDPITGIMGGSSSSVGSGDKDKTPVLPRYVVNENRVAPNNTEHPDCAGLRARVAQARDIQARNAAKILPGGIYVGGVSLSTNDAISLGAGIVGGIASFTDMALRDRAPLSGPLGSEIWRGNGVANTARTVSRVAVGVSIAADGYALVTADNNVDRAMAGANLATTGGVLGLPSAGLALLGPSVTWIGPAGLGLAAAQVGINAYVGYRLTSDQRETLGANAQQAWDTANRALETADSLQAQMQQLKCK